MYRELDHNVACNSLTLRSQRHRTASRTAFKIHPHVERWICHQSVVDNNFSMSIWQARNIPLEIHSGTRGDEIRLSSDFGRSCVCFKFGHANRMSVVEVVCEHFVKNTDLLICKWCRLDEIKIIRLYKETKIVGLQMNRWIVVLEGNHKGIVCI